MRCRPVSLGRLLYCITALINDDPCPCGSGKKYKRLLRRSDGEQSALCRSVRHLVSDTRPMSYGNFPLQKFPHLGGGSEFPVSPRVVRIINAPNTRLQLACLVRGFPAAAAD